MCILGCSAWMCVSGVVARWLSRGPTRRPSRGGGCSMWPLRRSTRANEATAKLEEVKRREDEALKKVKPLEKELQVLKGDLDVSYKFGYKIALTHFRTKHPGLEVEEDPYATLLEDDNVPMEAEVPIDDSDPTAM
ncbi:hypothetical protein GW17_00054298 [Ensete ventricosum]|nr:hypothetical protein GW17_00054298 [Ensete ventricosum]